MEGGQQREQGKYESQTLYRKGRWVGEGEETDGLVWQRSDAKLTFFRFKHTLVLNRKS